MQEETVLVARSNGLLPLLDIAASMARSRELPRMTLRQMADHAVGEFRFPTDYDLIPSVWRLLRHVSDTRGAHAVMETIDVKHRYDGSARPYTPISALALTLARGALDQVRDTDPLRLRHVSARVSADQAAAYIARHSARITGVAATEGDVLFETLCPQNHA